MQRKSHKRRHLLVAASLFVGALALYAPSLNGPFTYDSVNIANGSLLHITSLGQLEPILFAEGLPRRVGLTSFALNFYLDGLRPFGYHLVNVLLHATNAFLFFCLASVILQALPNPTRRRSLLVAASAAWLWMIHPIQTQAVSYVYQRFTVLCTSLCLLSLLLWVAAKERPFVVRLSLYAAAVVSGLLALGTKEIAATWPLMLLALELGTRPRPFTWRRRDVLLAGLTVAACLAIAAVYLGPSFVTLMANEYTRRGFTLSERLLTESRVVVHYLSLLAFPHPSRLTVDYDFALSTGLLTPPTTLVALGSVAALLGAATLRARRAPLFSLAVFWFFGNLAVESTVVPLDLVYEHRLYLPSMMLFLWLAATILGRPAAPRARNLVSGAVVLLACVWGYWTFQRNAVWRDPVALWEDNAAKAPGKARVQANLGAAYLASGRPTEARAALEKAIELDPSLDVAATSLANLHIDHTERWGEARRLLDEVIDRNPDYAPAYVSLGVISLRGGDYAEATRRFEKALELDETSQGALENLAVAHFERKDYASAVVVLQSGTFYWPANPRMQALLGAALVEMGERVEALAPLRRALALDPSSPLASRYLERAEASEP